MFGLPVEKNILSVMSAADLLLARLGKLNLGGSSMLRVGKGAALIVSCKFDFTILEVCS
jgi:hypothetical protein